MLLALANKKPFCFAIQGEKVQANCMVSVTAECSFVVSAFCICCCWHIGPAEGRNTSNCPSIQFSCPFVYDSRLYMFTSCGHTTIWYTFALLRFPFMFLVAQGFVSLVFWSFKGFQYIYFYIHKYLLILLKLKCKTHIYRWVSAILLLLNEIA